MSIGSSDGGRAARQSKLTREMSKKTHKKVVDTGCPALLILLAELAIALLLASAAELSAGETLLLAAPPPPAADEPAAAEVCALDSAADD